jgi:hypothetical protein
MPRYYFDVREGEKLVQDHAGADLSNLNEAIESARFYASRSRSQSGAEKSPLRVFEIRNSAGIVVANVPFSEDNNGASSKDPASEIPNASFPSISRGTPDHPAEGGQEALHGRIHHDDAGRT